MLCIALGCAVLSQHEAYSPCELKHHSTNPTLNFVLRDWCKISVAHNLVKDLAVPFKPADAVQVLENTTRCPLFPEQHGPGPMAFAANVCAQQNGRPGDSRFNVIALKCLPPTIAPQHLQTCTDLLAEVRLHWCSCGMGGDGCTNWRTNPQHFKKKCPIGMQDKGFWRSTYRACISVVGDWSARKLLYGNAQSPLEMLGIMTDCSKRFEVNYTQSYYAVENDRASKHAQAARSLHLQCLLAPRYTIPMLNDYPVLPKLVVEWSGQWCRDLF